MALCESGWTGDRCQLPLDHEGPHDNEVHPMDRPTIPNRDDLIEKGEALLEAMDDFTRELRRAHDRDSKDTNVRRFSSYHLADLEGNDDGGGWLASNLMADELRALVRQLDPATALAECAECGDEVREGLLDDEGRCESCRPDEEPSVADFHHSESAEAIAANRREREELASDPPTVPETGGRPWAPPATLMQRPELRGDLDTVGCYDGGSDVGGQRFHAMDCEARTDDECRRLANLRPDGSHITMPGWEGDR